MHVERLRSQPVDQSVEYETTQCLNLYESDTLQALATQARMGLHLRIQSLTPSIEAALVTLCEDDYPGWIAVDGLETLQAAAYPYRAPQHSRDEIQAKIPAVIAFAQSARSETNTYLWGGTVGPNYDCSGLVQHAFSSQGIWLPRDAYQQEAFVQPLQNPGHHPEDLIEILEPGDLIFFGTLKATHVALYLEDGTYIHSSGIAQGRNGIGLDRLTERGHPVSRAYYAQVRGAGRVMGSYQPKQQITD
jgi:cell wall-associated NlpC family hydrolase